MPRFRPPSDVSRTGFRHLPVSECRSVLAAAGCGPWRSSGPLCGLVFEAIVAAHQRRRRRDLYHSALEVHLDGNRFVIEMTPVWRTKASDRGVVGEGSVGLAPLGRSRLFRYEVRRWRDATIPDAAGAVDSPRRLSSDRARAQRVSGPRPRVPHQNVGTRRAGHRRDVELELPHFMGAGHEWTRH
jgi:hypothetical protein